MVITTATSDMDTSTRLAIPAPVEEIVKEIICAYRNDVLRRGGTPMCEVVSEPIRKVAAVLAGKADPRHTAVLLCGHPGTGKSTLLHAIIGMMQGYRAKLHPYVLAQRRLQRYLSTAYISAEYYAIALARHPDSERVLELPSMMVLAVDDIGEEPAEVNSYGLIRYPVRELLGKRYDSQLCTLLASNLTPAELTAKYGTRLGDRLAEMCEVIAMTGESYRRK